MNCKLDKCPECNKKVIEILNFKDGDKLFIHKRKLGLIGYNIDGCYIKKELKNEYDR